MAFWYLAGKGVMSSFYLTAVINRRDPVNVNLIKLSMQQITNEIRARVIRELIDRLNNELPYPGHISMSIIKNYLYELEHSEESNEEKQ